MIKANLLPNAKAEKSKVLGLNIEQTDVFRMLVTLGLCAILLIAFNITLDAQVRQRTNELDSTNQQLQTLAEQTNQVGVLTANVHRLQEVDRDSIWLKRSGQVKALRMISIGNEIPKGAWVDGIEQGKNGWSISGGSTQLEKIGNVVRGLSKISPGLNTTFQNVGTQQGYTYHVDIASPTPTPVPAKPVNEKLKAVTGGFSQ